MLSEGKTEILEFVSTLLNKKYLTCYIVSFLNLMCAFPFQDCWLKKCILQKNAIINGLDMKNSIFKLVLGKVVVIK